MKALFLFVATGTKQVCAVRRSTAREEYSIVDKYGNKCKYPNASGSIDSLCCRQYALRVGSLTLNPDSTMGTKKKPLTQSDLSKLGGKATYEKHGADHYRKMAEKRWGKKAK